MSRSRRSSLEQLEHRTLLSATPMDVALALTHSPEHYANVVAQQYEHYLGRSPDGAGLRFWVEQMEHGLAEEQLEGELLGCAEYVASHGGHGAGWVVGMYEDLLGRAPDDAGLAHWTTALGDGASPAAIAYGFATSRELEARRITGDYLTYLGRSPSAAEVDFWSERFEEGWTNKDIMASFVGSDEYFRRHGDYDAFLNGLYDDILDRPCDVEGRRHWLAAMDVEFEARLVGPTGAHGHAEFEIEDEHGNPEGEFDLEVEGAVPGTLHEVRVEDTVVGHVTIDQFGRGELTFSSGGDDDAFPLNFPPIRAGSVVTVSTILEGTFLAEHDED